MSRQNHGDVIYLSPDYCVKGLWRSRGYMYVFVLTSNYGLTSALFSTTASSAGKSPYTSAAVEIGTRGAPPPGRILHRTTPRTGKTYMNLSLSSAPNRPCRGPVPFQQASLVGSLRCNLYLNDWMDALALKPGLRFARPPCDTASSVIFDSGLGSLMTSGRRTISPLDCSPNNVLRPAVLGAPFHTRWAFHSLHARTLFTE